MDVWNKQVVDIGLAVIGYLAAAGLGMLLYSALAGRRKRVKAETATRRAHSEGGTPRPAELEPQVQFVDLRPRPDSAPRRAEQTSPDGTVSSRDGRRDRAEIIRLARQMLKTGTPSEMIRRTLPVTEMELTFLQNANQN